MKTNVYYYYYIRISQRRKYKRARKTLPFKSIGFCFRKDSNASRMYYFMRIIVSLINSDLFRSTNLCVWSRFNLRAICYLHWWKILCALIRTVQTYEIKFQKTKTSWRQGSWMGIVTDRTATWRGRVMAVSVKIMLNVPTKKMIGNQWIKFIANISCAK